MELLKTSRMILTLVLGIGSLMSFVLDWSANHLLNPLWHPHARFHSAILLFLFSGVSAIGIWLMWRRSREPQVAVIAAAGISASYWTPFFFVPYLLPEASWWAGRPGHEPHFGGMVIYPNLLIVALFLVATLVALALTLRSSRAEAG